MSSVALPWSPFALTPGHPLQIDGPPLTTLAQCSRLVDDLLVRTGLPLGSPPLHWAVADGWRIDPRAPPGDRSPHRPGWLRYHWTGDRQEDGGQILLALAGGLLRRARMAHTSADIWQIWLCMAGILCGLDSPDLPNWRDLLAIRTPMNSQVDSRSLS